MSKNCPNFYTFGDMSARLQNLLIENDYFNYLLTADEMMFTWKGLPDSIDPYRLEDFLNLTAGLVWQYNKKENMHMIAPFPALQGEIDMYGYGKDAHAQTLNGITLEGTVGKDIAVIYNNTKRSLQRDLFTTADIFTDIDSAAKCNVKFSRIAPIFATENDKQSTALNEMLQKVLEGEVKTIVSSGDIKLNSPLKESQGLQSIDAVTAPEKIQYLQYLSQYFDIRMRRHFMRRGLALKTSDKQAQVTTDEVHGLDAASWFYPLSKLQARKDGAEMVNRIFGTSITVEFSELWQQEYEAYKLRTAAEDMEEQAAHDQTERGVNNEEVPNENGAA